MIYKQAEDIALVVNYTMFTDQADPFDSPLSFPPSNWTLDLGILSPRQDLPAYMYSPTETHIPIELHPTSSIETRQTANGLLWHSGKHTWMRFDQSTDLTSEEVRLHCADRKPELGK